MNGAALGSATGVAGATVLSTIRGKNKELPEVGAVGGAVVGANLRAVSGAISGSVKYAAGKTAKFFGWTD